MIFDDSNTPKEGDLILSMILYYSSFGGFSPNIAVQYDTLFFQREISATKNQRVTEGLV
ncbi:hypothetical protein [Aliidiomarina quisquiliarum]|uniref:hypothetical protein n=1 Tax=Aliidiomarina quisquiliarum TaxID=2938947 RepID=UPI00208E9E6C|nr:hypothetical protein [Aliidiomarina quisquiliarum]MCO4321245.1 hypothetical protein [Aliidiomarina quisquiliarum]